MKKFITILGLCSLLFSCSKDEPEQKPEITGFKIEGALNGLDYDIRGIIDQSVLTIKLDRYIYPGDVLRPTVVATGDVYYLGSPLTKDTALDFSNEVKLLVTSATGATTAYKIIASVDPDDPGQYSDDNLLTSFSLDLIQNGAPITCPGVIDHNAGTVKLSPSLVWIGNIDEAKAVFAHEGRMASVGGVKQSSGTTPNDFSRSVDYTVTSGSGKKRTYTVSVACPQATGLPVMRIVTDSGSDIGSKTVYQAATVWLDDYECAEHNIGSARAGIRGRGNSTWNYSKKPYRIRFDDKTSVMGYGKARSWVLLANWQDPTFIMNTVAFELARRIGIPYTNHAEHVELYLNGTYRGSYVLTEQVQANPGRVEINEQSDYLIELDSYYDDDYKFKSAGLAMPVNIKSPDRAEVASPNDVLAQIKAAYEQMENAVMALSGWRDYMDVGSFIDFMIVNEITRNVELGHPKSTFLWKRAGGKWTWGPVWDFDWAYGYTGGQNYWSLPQGQIFTGGTGTSPGSVFFNKLFQDARFRAEYKARWNEIKPLIADIDRYVGAMGEALALSDVQNKRVWSGQYRLDYAGQISKMQQWLVQRIASLDSAINAY